MCYPNCGSTCDSVAIACRVHKPRSNTIDVRLQSTNFQISNPHFSSKFLPRDELFVGCEFVESVR